MAKKIKQEYGIKYPFTAQGSSGHYIDTNLDIKSKVRSILMHIIFTPKGQKIRDPKFGTDLIKYIFEPNENGTWDTIKTAISNAVSASLPYVSLNDIEMVKSEEDPYEVYVKMTYTIENGSTTINDSIITKV